MDEKKELTAEGEKAPKSAEEIQRELREKAAEAQARYREAAEAMSEGKGRLQLETPILAGDKEHTELRYDFNAITGLEYVDAMDTDPNAQQIYRITYRQGLALFARAAAKQTEDVDMRDIMDRIGGTDATVGVQLATSFFSASTRAGRMRISKM